MGTKGDKKRFFLKKKRISNGTYAVDKTILKSVRQVFNELVMYPMNQVCTEWFGPS